MQGASSTSTSRSASVFPLSDSRNRSPNPRLNRRSPDLESLRGSGRPRVVARAPGRARERGEGVVASVHGLTGRASASCSALASSIVRSARRCRSSVASTASRRCASAALLPVSRSTRPRLEEARPAGAHRAAARRARGGESAPQRRVPIARDSRPRPRLSRSTTHRSPCGAVLRDEEQHDRAGGHQHPTAAPPACARCCVRRLRCHRDARRHDRVGERQRRRLGEGVRPRQRRSAASCAASPPRPPSAATYRRCASGPSTTTARATATAFFPKATDPHQDRARNRRRRELGDVFGVLRGRLEPFVANQREKLAKEEGVPARRPVAGAAERGVAVHGRARRLISCAVAASVNGRSASRSTLGSLTSTSGMGCSCSGSWPRRVRRTKIGSASIRRAR